MPITMFDIPRVVQLTLPEAAVSEGGILMNYPINRTDFTVNKGLSQVISFLVKDIDRVVVDGSTVTLTIVIADPASDAVLLERPLVLIDPLQGLFGLQLTPLDTLDWPLGPHRYGITVTRADSSQTMLWTDRNYSPFGTLRVQVGPIPGPAVPVTLDPTTFVITDQWASSSALPVSQYLSGVQTFAIYSTLYTGTVKIQGTLLTQPDTDPTTWFDVLITPFVAVTGVTALTTTGNFTFARVQVAVPEMTPAFQTNYPVPIIVLGTVDKVLAKC